MKITQSVIALTVLALVATTYRQVSLRHKPYGLNVIAASEMKSIQGGVLSGCSDETCPNMNQCNWDPLANSYISYLPSGHNDCNIGHGSCSREVQPGTSIQLTTQCMGQLWFDSGCSVSQNGAPFVVGSEPYCS